MTTAWRRWLVRAALGSAGGLFLLAAAAYLALERQPRVSQAVAFTPAHIERAVRLFEQHDPHDLAAGAQDSISVSQGDLDLAVNFLASRYGRTSSRISLTEGGASVQTSTRLPPAWQGRYLNLRVELRETDRLPHIDHLRIGRLPVSPWLANRLMAMGLRHLRAQTPGTAVAMDGIRQITARGGMLNVAYTWPGKAQGLAPRRLWSAEEQARIEAYGQLLADTESRIAAAPQRHRPQQAHTLPMPRTPREVPLARLVQPLLEQAMLRSRDHGSAVAENRAAIVALALFVNGHAMGSAWSGTGVEMPFATRAITLGGRPDTAQHFTVSAALAATAGRPLSDAVGLYKELNDARGGSGFSFNDLAADRAGTRFGERATVGEIEARQLHRQLPATLREADFLPKVRDLPESLQENEFNRRFGGLGGAGYQRLRADIETRIAALPLYR